MASRLKKGDRVQWKSSGGKSKGKVVEAVTKPRKVKAFKAAASPEEPEYVVQSETSGKKAIHKREALRKQP